MIVSRTQIMNVRCLQTIHTCIKFKWERSLRRWEHKQTKRQRYNKPDPRSQYDENNVSVTHFGLGPDLFPISHICLGIFHCKCAIIRQLMLSVRKLLMNLSHELRNEFANTVLKSFWSDFKLFLE